MSRWSQLLCDGRALLDADRLLGARVADRRASFELSFTVMPPHTGFLVVAGVEAALEAIARARPSEEQVEAAQRAAGFSDALAQRLVAGALRVDVDAVPEGTIAFAAAPIVTVEGPLLEAALVGALLAPLLRRGTAVATRAARLHVAAGGGVILDGSSARAGSPHEAIEIARAAHAGGAAATTSALAAAALGIPFRGDARIDLGALAPAEAPSGGAWGPSTADRLVDLGAGDDEEALLVEALRVGAAAGGWVASGLAGGERLAAGYELVALEEEGAWSPRRGASDRADVTPGRKMIARYFDDAGRAVADVVHLFHERMLSPRAFGAAKVAPLARTAMRGGHALEAPEPPSAARERSVSARGLLPPAVTHLRSPARYRVELSPGVLAQRDRPPPVPPP